MGSWYDLAYRVGMKIEYVLRKHESLLSSTQEEFLGASCFTSPREGIGDLDKGAVNALVFLFSLHTSGIGVLGLTWNGHTIWNFFSLYFCRYRQIKGSFAQNVPTEIFPKSSGHIKALLSALTNHLHSIQRIALNPESQIHLRFGSFFCVYCYITETSLGVMGTG